MTVDSTWMGGNRASRGAKASTCHIGTQVPGGPARLEGRVPALTTGPAAAVRTARPPALDLSTSAVAVQWSDGTPGLELDVSALICGEDRQVLSDDHFIFYNKQKTPDGAVTLGGSAMAGAVNADRATISMHLDRLPLIAHSVVLAVTVDDGTGVSRFFDKVPGAIVRVWSATAGVELASYRLSERHGDRNALVYAEFWRSGAHWRFRAIGQDYPGGLHDIARRYGVDV